MIDNRKLRNLFEAGVVVLAAGVSILAMLAATSCGGKPNQPPKTSPNDFTTYGLALSGDDRINIHQQIDKAHEIALQKHQLQPLAKSRYRFEILDTDVNCEDPISFKIPETGQCVGGRYIPPGYGEDERIQVTLPGLRGGLVVWYEAEHMILFHRDNARFWATLDHSVLPHPILGD